MPKYYPINEEAAKRAKDMNSFSDYQPGSATAGYRAMVDEAYAAAERQKARVDPMYHDKIDTLVDRYARKLAENLNERNVIDARVPSILISGGGNFPVTKKHKQNAARDRNYGEYAEISKLLDKIRSVGMGGISADDDLAVEKLTKKLEGLESQQTTMKAVNAYFRKHKTLDGCPELTPEQAEKLKADMAQSWHLDKSSMNGVTMEMTAPRWNRISQTGCRTISVFIMSGSGRPRLPAFTSIIRPSGLWTSGHSRSRLITSRMKSSITISASRWKMARSWLGAILPIPAR